MGVVVSALNQIFLWMSFHSTIAQALGAIRQITGIKITYARESQSVQLIATPTSQLQSSDQQDEFAYDANTRDWVINANLLILGGVVVEPSSNDTITEVTGGKVYTYEVRRPGGQQPWSYIDTGRSSIRIHTILKDVANA